MVGVVSHKTNGTRWQTFLINKGYMTHPCNNFIPKEGNSSVTYCLVCGIEKTQHEFNVEQKTTESDTRI